MRRARPALAAALCGAIAACPAASLADSAVSRALSQGSESGGVTWAKIKPLLENLAGRSAAFAPAPGMGELRTPVFTTMGGASHLTIGRPFFGVQLNRIQPEAQTSEMEWVDRHATTGSSKAALTQQYVALLRGGEAELQRQGLRVASVGSAFEYYLKAAYAAADGPETLSSEQEQVVRGWVVASISAAESNPNSPRFATDGQREARYEEFLVEAQALHEAAGQAGSKDEGETDLKAVQIDPAKTRLSTIVCALESSESCPDLQHDANPILEELAAKYPY